ncbi:MAG TPA: histidine kinase [Bifidobacterium dentium]|nr:histidine kinase [Bifidobacterium dentium]
MQTFVIITATNQYASHSTVIMNLYIATIFDSTTYVENDSILWYSNRHNACRRHRSLPALT